MSRRLLWTIVWAFVVALMLVGCGGGADQAATPAEQPTQGSATGQSAEEPAEQPAASAPAPMGTAASAGDWTITVKEVEREQSTGGVDATAGNELLIIKYDLTNGGSADQGTGPVDYTLADATGATFTAAQTSDDKFIFNIPQPIKAGETREIRIAYEVPTGSGPFVWTFAPFGAETPAVLEVK